MVRGIHPDPAVLCDGKVGSSPSRLAVSVQALGSARVSLGEVAVASSSRLDQGPAGVTRSRRAVQSSGLRIPLYVRPVASVSYCSRTWNLH